GYIIWGVRDGFREIVGTSFKPSSAKVGNEELSNWLLRSLDPQIYFKFHETLVDGAPVVLLEIERARHRPISFHGDEYIRVGSYKKKLKDHPDHARRLWKLFVLGSFEEEVAVGRLGPSDVLRLLDYPTYFDLMRMPLPESRSGILEALTAEGMVTSA